MAIVAVAERPPRSPPAPRRDHRRLHLRGRAGDRRPAPGRRRDDGDPQGDAQAEPDPDARGPGLLHALRPVREHRARQQLARRGQGRAQARRHRASPSPASRSDMGMEKFLDIVCRHRRARSERGRRRHHGAGAQAPRRGPGRRASTRVERGSANLERHIGIVKEFGLEPVVAVNRRPEDTDEECEVARKLALDYGAYAAELNEAFAKGGDGATALAEAVVGACEQPNSFAPVYGLDEPIADKIEKIATRVYGADGREAPARRAREDRALHKGRARQGADLHGQDASLAVARPDPRERADRFHAAGSRPARLYGRRAGSSRSAATCRRCPASASRPRSRTSTSTPTARRSGCSRPNRCRPQAGRSRRIAATFGRGHRGAM